MIFLIRVTSLLYNILILYLVPKIYLYIYEVLTVNILKFDNYYFIKLIYYTILLFVGIFYNFYVKIYVAY